MKCVVCDERRPVDALWKLCAICLNSFPGTVGGTAAIVAWAARRARTFEAKRAAKRPPPTCAKILGTEEAGPIRCALRRGHKGGCVE